MKGLPQSPCGVTSPLLEEERMDLGEFSTCILCKEGKRWRDKWEFVPMSACQLLYAVVFTGCDCHEVSLLNNLYSLAYNHEETIIFPQLLIALS